MAQHPEWVRFSRAFQEGRFAEALATVDALLVEYPDEYWLYWHRANCLEKLERYGEIEAALDRALSLEPNFVRAIVQRVRYAGWAESEADVMPSEEMFEAMGAYNQELAKAGVLIDGMGLQSSRQGKRQNGRFRSD